MTQYHQPTKRMDKIIMENGIISHLIVSYFNKVHLNTVQLVIEIFSDRVSISLGHVTFVVGHFNL